MVSRPNPLIAAAAATVVALIALAIGRADYEIAVEADQERAEVTMVRVGGRINHGLLDAVKSVDECARLAKLPPPDPCSALPCGWVVNVSCWSSSGHPCWHTLCQIPMSTKEK